MSTTFFSQVLDDPYYVNSNEYLSVITSGKVRTEGEQARDINKDAAKYLNRLSDWFFVAGRVANNNGADDILWVPGANR